MLASEELLWESITFLVEDSSAWALVMGLALVCLVLLGILPLQDAFLLSQSHPCAPWL